jgi:Protein of unknown function (DUF3800)
LKIIRRLRAVPKYIITMAYILFLDESGHDLKDSPYEVIAGIAIEDKSIWNLIRELHLLEEHTFGRRYSQGQRELKARKILKSKTFRLANQLPPIDIEERRLLAKECLENGETATKKQLTALAQAKISFAKELLQIVANFRCKAFASIVSPAFNPADTPEFLRKDFIYLFERYFYFLEDKPEQPSGIIVFDETEKTQSQRLIAQIENYFKKTFKGRTRASLLIPEPLFVHSDLTTGVQIADLIAYVISWSLRLNGMNKPIRNELLPLAELVKPLRNRVVREVGEIQGHEIWSITYVQ